MEQIKLEASNEQTSPERLSQLAKLNPTLASLVANNPNATAELLTELADREEDFIRKNVAANPNTPTEVLWKLGEEFPQEVLENAVLPLLLLENPNLINEIPYDAFIKFLTCINVPISFMEQVVNRNSLREWLVTNYWYQGAGLSITMNPQTPRDILDKLIAPPETIPGLAAQLHVNYAGELEEDWQVEFGYQIPRWGRLAEIMYSLPYDGDGYFFPILAAIGLVPEFFFKSLARHEEAQFRGLIAPIAPLSLLENLARDINPKVRGETAYNPIAPSELLELLARDDFLEVRCIVAEHPNVSPRVLERLAADEQPKVRQTVAKNQNAPTYLLEELAFDNKTYLAVASNLNAPKILLERFASSKLKENPKLKKILATNPNTPIDVLEKLQGERPIVRQSIAANPSAPKYLLEKFANSSRDALRHALASNPKLPEDIVDLLARDKSSWVRGALAANPNIPIAILMQLSQDRRANVRRTVAVNPKAPNSILRESLLDLLQYRKKIDLKSAILRYASENPDRLPLLLEQIVKQIKQPSDLTRTIALWHPQMPVKVLEKNVRSFVWLERCAIAQNPNTPKETLQLLAADGNRIVRAAAKENLKSKFDF